MLFELWSGGNPSAIGAATGAVCGLVGITPAAGFVPGALTLESRSRCHEARRPSPHLLPCASPAVAALVAGPIGMISSAVSFLFVWVCKHTPYFEWLENPQDVFSSHGVTALVGSLASGFFAYVPVNKEILEEHGNGLLYGGGFKMLLSDIGAVTIVCTYGIGMTVLILHGLKKTLGNDGLYATGPDVSRAWPIPS